MIISASSRMVRYGQPAVARIRIITNNCQVYTYRTCHMALRALIKPVSGSYKGVVEKSSVAKLYRFLILYIGR
jgi:hypothetical protein